MLTLVLENLVQKHLTFTQVMIGIFHNKPFCESNPTANTKVIILGGGPNRIGQGIEFDYCCVHAVYALKEKVLKQ